LLIAMPLEQHQVRVLDELIMARQIVVHFGQISAEKRAPQRISRSIVRFERLSRCGTDNI